MPEVCQRQWIARVEFVARPFTVADNQTLMAARSRGECRQEAPGQNDRGRNEETPDPTLSRPLGDLGVQHSVYKEGIKPLVEGLIGNTKKALR
ncbi:MAG: hypothetical protein CL693_21955 [Cellvibrionaceae bacterium]|nr:hypothetical protein [Cellvibrionaceae bacterium]MAZ90305.1 hypothetical protein [Cellvibrionaceae bacterium]